ncbi:hypothetical protein BJ170DRAFT_589214 [Xylariales sp. AK1849]|nr:hypothetical protein BJ170DRAFT_589214 [Xylariales sp. AK1849]
MMENMQSYQSLFPRLEPILLDRDFVCLCILVQLVLMYLVGSLAAILITTFSPRANALPARRQQQLAVAIPVILLKGTIMYLITDSLISLPGFRGPHGATGAGPSLDYRFQTLFFIAISYMFEILQRPSSAELVIHHLYLQALPFYYWFWLRYRPLAQAEVVTRFFELMVLLGPGATDIASDSTFLLYYCAPRSRAGLFMIRGMSWIATGARALQWAVLTGYGYLNYGVAKETLSGWEKGTFILSVVLWVWTEVDEILKVRGMVGKFSINMKKKKGN